MRNEYKTLVGNPEGVSNFRDLDLDES